MPRGGRRQGAGPPRANFNALKHGKSSPRVRAVLAALASLPQVRSLMLGLARKGHMERVQFSRAAMATARILYEPDMAGRLRDALQHAIDEQLDAHGQRAAERARDAVVRYEYRTGLDAGTDEPISNSRHERLRNARRKAAADYLARRRSISRLIAPPDSPAPEKRKIRPEQPFNQSLIFPDLPEDDPPFIPFHDPLGDERSPILRPASRLRRGRSAITAAALH